MCGNTCLLYALLDSLVRHVSYITPYFVLSLGRSSQLAVLYFALCCSILDACNIQCLTYAIVSVLLDYAMSWRHSNPALHYAVYPCLWSIVFNGPFHRRSFAEAACLMCYPALAMEVPLFVCWSHDSEAGSQHDGRTLGIVDVLLR